MNQDRVKFFILGILAGGVTLWVFMNNFVSDTGKIATPGTIPSSNKDIMDAHFIEQMIPHHEDAILMAKLAPQYSQREEIKNLSENIIKAQESEINQMKSWYKKWYGRDLPSSDAAMHHHATASNESHMHMGIAGDETDIKKITESTDFDIAFLEHMIPHHQMAVMMASMLRDGTQKEEMKELADNIITTQTKEIDQMRLWLKEWRSQQQ